MIKIPKKYFIGLYIIIAGVIIVIIAVINPTDSTAQNGSDNVITAGDISKSDNSNDSNNIDNIRDKVAKIVNPQVRQPDADEAEKYPQLTNLPAMYITIKDAPLSAVTKESYIPGEYTLVYGDEGGIYNEPLEIIGRGNYSWDLPQKPYRIGLTRPVGLLGMNTAKKWILLGDYVDKTLLRSYLTFTFSRDLLQDFSPDCRYIDLFFNGQYNGTYLLIEAIQIHENRINIDKETEGLFEIEAIYRHGEHEYCIDMIGGEHHIMYKKPEETDISPETKLSNLEKFKDFFKKFEESLSEGYGSYSKYMDVESFVDWYIINEFCKNFDSAFTSSCYCFIKDGKLHMGPVWDYHTCYGNQEVATCLRPTGYHVSGSPWYSILTKDETFSRLIRDRWTQLRDDGVIFNAFVSRLQEATGYISESAKKDQERWPDMLKYNGLRGTRSKYTYDEELEYLKNWISTRIEWLDGEWYNGK